MKKSMLRRIIGGRGTVLGAFALMVFYAQFTLAVPAGAAPFSGGFGPTIVSQKADLNGDGVVTGRDDANAFYGDTSIIDGQLDCNAWGATANAGTAGDGVITSADDCSLVGYDGTLDGVTIHVVDGAFQVADGPLPVVFNAADPSNPSVAASDFAWSTIGGRVDSNGSGTITGDDCTFGLIGQTVDVGLGDATDGADVLGNPGANECGFATPPNTADNGLVDLNSDTVITSADTCTNGCFFGHNVTLGQVQAFIMNIYPSTVTVAWNATTHNFHGEVTSTRAGCVAGRTVNLYKEVPGINPVLATAITGSLGGWHVMRTSAHGKFYAVVTRSTTRDNGHLRVCALARSTDLTV
jgi:hypothetical protein